MPDDLTVILDHIRNDAESEITHPDDECGIKVGGFCVPHGTLRAVAALEAVLKLADRYDTIPAYGPTPGARHEVARRICEAISRRLAGKEGSGR